MHLIVVPIVIQFFFKRFIFDSFTLLLEFMPDGKISTLKREAEALVKIVEGL